MQTFITLFLIAIAGYLIWETFNQYQKAEGSTWERIKAAFRGSVTIAWARLNALSALAVSGVAELGTMLGHPGVKEAIEPYLQPTYMLVYVVIMLVGAEIARRRPV